MLLRQGAANRRLGLHTAVLRTPRRLRRHGLRRLRGRLVSLWPARLRRMLLVMRVVLRLGRLLVLVLLVLMHRLLRLLLLRRPRLPSRRGRLPPA